jgi:hypothetical protein
VGRPYLPGAASFIVGEPHLEGPPLSIAPMESHLQLDLGVQGAGRKSVTVKVVSEAVGAFLESTL